MIRLEEPQHVLNGVERTYPISVWWWRVKGGVGCGEKQWTTELGRETNQTSLGTRHISRCELDRGAYQGRPALDFRREHSKCFQKK